MSYFGKSGAFGAYNEYDKTPFKAFGVEERWIDKPGSSQERRLVDEETGEVFVWNTPPKRICVSHDPAKYVKVFRGADISGISVSGKAIILYVAYFLKMNKDSIYLHWSTVSEWCGISKSSFYNAVKELLDADILAIKSKKSDFYWVNPNYVFNGNRTKI